MRLRRPKNRDELAKMHRRAAGPLAFGTNFAAGMAIFAIGGNWLGRKYGQETTYTLIGVLLGFVYGGYELWKLVRRANTRIAEEDAAKKAAEEEA